MATHFSEPMEVPIVDQEDLIAPMPSVPNYAAFQESIVVVGEGGSIPVGLIEPRGVTIEPTTETIYVTDFKNGLIHIFSQTGDYINHFGDPFLSDPWGILIHLDNIYVTDKRQNAIFLFRLTDLKMVKTVGKKGSGREEFRYPKQLAISPNQHLYVADADNHRLQILTTDLEFTNSLRHQTMKKPFDVKFSNNEMFVLSGLGSPCIHVFTLSEEKTRSLVTRGIGMQVKGALFFCLDGHNNILISDYSSHNIKVFSQAGDLLHTIKKTECIELTASPIFMMIDNDNRIVCAYSLSSYCLRIFYAKSIKLH